jgi:hypothetical protein
MVLVLLVAVPKEPSVIELKVALPPWISIGLALFEE